MDTLIARVTSGWFTPVALALGVFLWLRGHDALGGGFLGAGVIALAAVFHDLTIGAGPLERLARRGVSVVIGTGLLLMIGTGIGGYLWGAGFLHAASHHWTLPVIGTVTLSTTLLFEFGVGAVVLGVVVAVVQQLGEER